MDGEVQLHVGQFAVVVLCDDQAHGHGLVRTGATVCAGSCTTDCYALYFLAGFILLTAIVELIFSICWCQIRQVSGRDIERAEVGGLLIVAQVTQVISRDGGSRSVGLLVVYEGLFHHVVCACARHLDGYVVALFVRQPLILCAAQFLAIGNWLRDILVVLISLVREVGEGFCSVIRCRVVDGRLQRVGGRVGLGSGLCSGLAVVLVLRAFLLHDIVRNAVCRIDEQVEGIVVELEVATVLRRHRAPCGETTVVLVGRVVVAAIETGLGTVVGLHDVLVDFFGYLLFGIGGIALVVCVVERGLLCCRHQVALEDELVVGQLDGLGADEGWNNLVAVVVVIITVG